MLLKFSDDAMSKNQMRSVNGGHRACSTTTYILLTVYGTPAACYPTMQACLAHIASSGAPAGQLQCHV